MSYLISTQLNNALVALRNSSFQVGLHLSLLNIASFAFLIFATGRE